MSTGWFQPQWPNSWSLVHIAVKEIVPIVVAAGVSGKLWGGLHVRFHFDNMAVIAVLNKHTTKDVSLLHFLCCLYFYASYKFHYSSSYIPGALNTYADTLSQNFVHDFSPLFQQVPPTTVLQVMEDYLVHKRPNWISNKWMSLFSLSLAKEMHRAPPHPISQVRGDTSLFVPTTHYSQSPSLNPIFVLSSPFSINRT